MPKNIILLLGNPGTGKSSIVNCLAGTKLFESGVSYGKGLTFEFHKREINGVTYIDTPGLADTQLEKDAAVAIKKALTQEGDYQIFFMVRLHEGRVVNEDILTVERVMNSIATPNMLFSIIVNKVEEDDYNILTEGQEDFDKTAWLDVLTSINSGTHKTLSIFLLKKIGKLNRAKNKLTVLPKDFREFVAKAPRMTIREDDISDIATDAEVVQKMREELAKEVEAMRNDHAMATDHLKRVIEDQEKAMKELQERNNQQNNQPNVGDILFNMLPPVAIAKGIAQLFRI